MEIKNLKDVKEVLKKIPDEVLEEFGFGQNEDCELGLLNWNGDDPMVAYVEGIEKYPKLNDLCKWFKTISRFVQYCEVNGDNDTIGYEDMISTEDLQKIEDYLERKKREEEY